MKITGCVRLAWWRPVRAARTGALACLAVLLASATAARADGTAPATPPRAAAASADMPAGSSEELATWRARAGQSHKALVLEFGATWCGPCQVFDRQVLPQSSVQRALGSVVFVHYDAETAVGKTAARGLGILGYPTFVALGEDGREIGRLQGYRDAGEFSQWVQSAAADAEPTPRLEARAAAAGAPAAVLLQLARRHLKSGNEPSAVALLTRAGQAAAPGSQAAADIDWELRLLLLRQLLREQPRKAMIEHLGRYATGPTADAAFLALSRMGPADAATRAVLGRYIDAHLDAGAAEQLNDAVYACLRAGALAEAERGARRLVELDGKNPRYLDTLAEVMHLRGDRTSALRYSREAVAALGKAPAPGATTAQAQEQQQTRAALLKNQARFDRGQRELPPDLKAEDDYLQPWEKN
jgi:thiol-disulfide isomerase/thioredoxin